MNGHEFSHTSLQFFKPTVSLNTNMFPKQKIDKVPDNDRIRTFFPLSIPVDCIIVDYRLIKYSPKV